jgi:hypothetical protein
LKRCGQRRERQFVLMHGGHPQKLELREENECYRDSPWDRLPMRMSHGQPATTSIHTMPHRLAKPIKTTQDY